jgi:hypothetical protein
MICNEKCDKYDVMDVLDIDYHSISHHVEVVALLGIVIMPLTW